MRPAEPYTDAAYARREHDRVFRGAWLVAARSADLAEGAWRTLDYGSEAVILGRQDGVATAVHNSCAHRGMRLCDGAGAGRLVCPYHGWAYDPGGRVRSAPGAGSAAADLARLRCEEAFGFAWIATGDPPPLGDWLAPVADRLRAWELDRWSTVSDVTVELDCNWKLSQDVHLEAYHVPTVHAEIGSLVGWDAAAFEPLGPHGRLVVPPRDPRVGENELLFLFPNVQLNLHPHEALVFRHRPHPRDPERCAFDQIGLSRTPPAARPAWRLAKAGDRELGPITSADLRMAERLQRGVRTDGYAGPRFTAHEALAAHAHRGLAERA